MSKVPVVIYKDGMRAVIGEAEVTIDEEGVKASATISEEYSSLFDMGVASFSIGSWAQEVEKRSCLDTPSLQNPPTYGSRSGSLLVQDGRSGESGSDQAQGRSES